MTQNHSLRNTWLSMIVVPGENRNHNFWVLFYSGIIYQWSGLIPASVLKSQPWQDSGNHEKLILGIKHKLVVQKKST